LILPPVIPTFNEMVDDQLQSSMIGVFTCQTFSFSEAPRSMPVSKTGVGPKGLEEQRTGVVSLHVLD
jgi:hypothetical protein